MPAGPCVPGGVSLGPLSLRDMLQNEQLTFPLCAPHALQIALSIMYVHGLFVLLFLQEQP